MAVSSKVGTFTIASTDTVGTTQEITVGFEPKVIFFWTMGNPSVTDSIVNANTRYGFGAASSTTSRRAVGGRSTDGSISINGGRIMRNDACLALCLNTSGIDGLLDISAISSTSFTTIVDDQFTADIRVSYMAVGGSDITNVDIGDITAATSTGNQSVTGIGFQPDFLLNFGTASTTAPNNTSASRDFLSVGAAVSATDQAIISMGEGPEGNATSLAKSYLYYGEVSAPLFDTPTSIANRATFVSFDSDGWTVNWLEAAYAYRLFYVAIKGGLWTVGNLTTQTDTSTSIVKSGFGFTPAGVMLLSHMTTQSAQDTPQDHGAISIGAFTGASERVAQALFMESGLADTRVASAIEHDSVYINIASAATSTVQGLADVVSMDSDGFTLIMDDADPSTAYAFYFAVGNASTGITGTADKSIGNIAPSAAGQIALSATASKTISSITPSASGALSISAIGSQSIGSIAPSAAGQLAISATASASMGVISGTSAGQVAILATSTSGIGSIAGVGAGTLPINATASAAIGTIARAASGALSVVANASRGTGSISQVASGQAAIIGIANDSIGGIAQAASGQISIGASADHAIGEIAQAAIGGSTNTGNASVSVGEVAGASAGALAITGGADVSIGQIGRAATGKISISGIASQLLGGISGIASAALQIVAIADVSIGEISQVANGGSANTGSVDSQVGEIVGTGAGALAIAGISDGSIGYVAGASSATLLIVAIATVTIGGIAGSASAAIETSNTGVAGVNIGIISQVASGQLLIVAIAVVEIAEIAGGSTSIIALGGAGNQDIGEIICVAASALAIHGSANISIGIVSGNGTGIISSMIIQAILATVRSGGRSGTVHSLEIASGSVRSYESADGVVRSYESASGSVRSSVDSASLVHSFS